MESRVLPTAERPDVELWALDPLFAANVTLLAAQLHALPDAVQAPAGDVIWLGNHPVQHLDVCGVVVSVDPKNAVPGADRRVSFQLDDGTGLIDCVCWLSEEAPIEQQRQQIALVRLGVVLRVLGTVRRYRDRRQVSVDDCWVERDGTLAECLHWLRAAELWRTCYSRPFREPASAGQQRLDASPLARAQAPPGPRQPPAAAFDAAVREVLSHADSPGLSVRSIVSRLPAAVTALVVPAGSRASSERSVLSEAVGEAMGRLQEASAVYAAADQRRGETLWRALE